MPAAHLCGVGAWIANLANYGLGNSLLKLMNDFSSDAGH